MQLLRFKTTPWPYVYGFCKILQNFSKYTYKPSNESRLRNMAVNIRELVKNCVMRAHPGFYFGGGSSILISVYLGLLEIIF